MLIERYAFIEFTSPSADFKGATVILGPVAVSVIESDDYEVNNAIMNRTYSKLLVRAVAEVQSFRFRIVDSQLVIPSEIIKLCDRAIESLGNGLSVLNGSGRNITSPTTPVRLRPQWLGDRKLLRRAEAYQKAKTPNLVGRKNKITDISILNELHDREQGVALLAEAFGNENAAGKYREFVRLFELAFGDAITNLGKRLTNFLDASLKISRKDVQDWISLRHPMSHADMKKSEFIAYESDVTPYVQKMEEAAIDVLFNKKFWTERGTERRDLLGDIGQLKDGTTISLSLMDDFNSFPLGLNSRLLIDGWPLK